MELKDFKMPTITRTEINAWQQYLVGKSCPKHPQNLIKTGNYGNWCGQKDILGTWCNGGFPTEDFLKELRKEHND